MTRPKFTPAERKAVLERQDNPKGAGHCWHCGLCLEDVATWHVDHHPVAFRDIEDQIVCGVVDAKAEGNLVPSCVPCNTSHKHEQGRWWWCGHTQLRVTRVCVSSLCAVTGWSALALVALLWSATRF